MDGEKQHGSGWGQHHLEASKRKGLALCVERQGSLGTGVEAARVQACLEWATAFLGVLEGRYGTGKHTERVCGRRPSIIFPALSSCPIPTPQTLVLGPRVI